MQASGSSVGRRELCPSSERTPFDEESAAEQVSYVQSNIFSTGRKSRLRIQFTSAGRTSSGSSYGSLGWPSFSLVESVVG